MIFVPVLTTPRLRLRGFDVRDFEPLAEMLAHPDLARVLGDGRSIDRAEAWRRLAGILGHWVLRGHGLWALEERASGAFAGWAGLIQPEGWPALEIAYSLARPFWGRGYAREAAAASLAYAHETLHRTEVISIIRPANLGSIRVATALGATRAETIDFFGAPSDVYRYPLPAGVASRAQA
ncbi:MAG TPA: GNAT family N-acetyltransferase [Gemmatimonadales bacterium]